MDVAEQLLRQEQRIEGYPPAVVSKMRDHLVDLGLRVEHLRTFNRSPRREGPRRSQHVLQDRLERKRNVSPPAPLGSMDTCRLHAFKASARRCEERVRIMAAGIKIL